MSKFRFPTQKGTDLFPVVVKRPCQVYFEGVTHGSPVAGRLFHLLQGKLDYFYHRGAHAHELGIVEQSVRHFREPGIEMRYENNYGAERIFVKLEPGVIEAVEEQLRRQVKEFELRRIIVIDLLVESEYYIQSDTFDEGLGNVVEWSYTGSGLAMEVWHSKNTDAETYATNARISSTVGFTVPQYPRLTEDSNVRVGDTIIRWPLETPIWSALSAFNNTLSITGDLINLEHTISYAQDADPGPLWLTCVAARPLSPDESCEITIGLISGDPLVTGAGTTHNDFDGPMKLRVRELIAEEPALHAQKLSHYELVQYEFADDEYTNLQPYSWLLAGGGWAPTVNSTENGSLENPGMGELLAETVWFNKEVTYESDANIASYAGPVWPGAEGFTTEVATISYEPNSDPIRTGEAEITLL